MTTRATDEFAAIAQNFTKRCRELADLLIVARWAINRMTGVARLTKALGKPDNEVATAKEIEELSERQLSEGFPLLHNSAAVLIWGALETTVRDWVIAWAASDLRRFLKSDARDLKLSLEQWIEIPEEDRARAIVEMLERGKGANLKKGIGRFDSLLTAVGIDPVVSAQDRKHLYELSSLRNVIAHRASVADQKFVKDCGNLGYAVGDAICVSNDQLCDFLLAAQRYVDALSLAAARSEEMPSDMPSS